MTDVIDTEVIESLSDFNLLGSVEESVGELLSLTKSRLNDLEAANIAQEVSHWLVRIRRLVWVLSGFDTGETWVSYVKNY